MKRASPKGKVPITHEDVQKAIKQYVSKGGQIKVLPSQKVMSVNVIGADKWDAYESLTDICI